MRGALRCVWLLPVRSAWPLQQYFSLKMQPVLQAERTVWDGCAQEGAQGFGLLVRSKPYLGNDLGAQLRGLVIGTASGAAGRAYSALDDFMEFHRGGACPASFHAEA